MRRKGGVMQEVTDVLWAEGRPDGYTRRKLADGTVKHYEKRRWRVTDYITGAYQFDEPTMPRKIAKVTNRFKRLLKDGWAFQVVKVMTKEITTREIIVVDGEGVSPLHLLAELSE